MQSHYAEGGIDMAGLRSKSNKKFMVLSALCIFMVVDHHTFTAFNLFGDYMPYNSFFMPLFVFISGYFNNVDAKTNLLTYIWKKIKHLLFPYIGLSLFVFVIELLMDWYKTGITPEVPDWYLSYCLDRVITIGSFGAIVGPMWFVLPLFLVLVVYAIVKKLMSMIKIWNSFVMLALFIAAHLFVVYCGKNADPEAMTYFLIPFKAMFFLPFLEMGVIYRNYLEGLHSKIPAGGKVGLAVLMLAVNAVRTMYLPNGYDIAFDSIDDLSGFTSPYIVTPLVSSVVGMIFWLTIVELIGKAFYESKFVNYMSCNTFWIMGLHIMFFNILNCILLAISENVTNLQYFDAEYFRETEWYFWEISPNFKMFYVVIGILGPLGIKWIWDRLFLAVGKLFAKKEIPQQAT